MPSEHSRDIARVGRQVLAHQNTLEHASKRIFTSKGGIAAAKRLTAHSCRNPHQGALIGSTHGSEVLNEHTLVGCESRPSRPHTGQDVADIQSLGSDAREVVATQFAIAIFQQALSGLADAYGLRESALMRLTPDALLLQALG